MTIIIHSTISGCIIGKKKKKNGKDLILAHETAGQAAIRESGKRGCKIPGIRAAIPTWEVWKRPRWS